MTAYIVGKKEHEAKIFLISIMKVRFLTGVPKDELEDQKASKTKWHRSSTDKSSCLFTSPCMPTCDEKDLETLGTMGCKA